MAEGGSASADAIAREAGVTRSVLYRHFKGRDELIAIAVQRPFEAFRDAFRDACCRQDDHSELSDWDIEREFMSQLVQLFRAHHAFLGAVLSPRSPLRRSHQTQLRRQLRSTIDELVAVVIDEIQTRDRGYRPEVVSVALRLEVAMVSGLITHADWLLPQGGDSWSAAEILDHLTAFTLYGARLADGARR